MQIDELRRNDAHELQLANDISRDASEVFGSLFSASVFYLFYLFISPIFSLLISLSFLICVTRFQSRIFDLDIPVNL